MYYKESKSNFKAIKLPSPYRYRVNMARYRFKIVYTSPKTHKEFVMYTNYNQTYDILNSNSPISQRHLNSIKRLIKNWHQNYLNN